MRTKHLLAAMAMPLLFAACSQNDFETISNPVDGNRKTVGKVTLNVNDAATRMNFVGGETPYQWVAGDKFGACLMDQDKTNGNMYAGETFWNRFELVDYIHTNYPFTRQENGYWTSEAVMSEGNYFYYFPYDYNLGGRRSAMKLNIETEQVLKDGEKASTVLKNQLFVGYAPVIAEEGKVKENVSVTMEPLLAFPGFRLSNTGNKTINVKKIALVADGGFTSYYEVKPKAANFENAGFAAMNAAKQREEVLKVAQEGTDNKAAQISLAFGKDGKTLTTGKKCLGYIMMAPATLTNPKLYIYTDKGLGVAKLDKAHMDAGAGAANITNDRALTSVKYNDGALVNIEFDDTALDTPLELDVYTTDELESLVYWSRENTSAELTANLKNDEVALTQKVVDILKANKKLSLKIYGGSTKFDLNIPAGISNDALMQNIAISNADVVVAEGADIKVPAMTVDVKNAGKIELVGASYTTVENKGEVVISKKNATVATLKNNGKVNVNAIASSIATLENNTAELTIAAGKVLTVSTAITNGFNDNGDYTYSQGKITVDGTLNIQGTTSENKGVIVVNKGAELLGAIVNETVQEYVINSRGTKAPVYPTIVNSGFVNGVVNKGMVEMADVDARQTSAAASTGYVENTILSPYVTKIDTEKILVVVEGANKATELQTLVKKSNARELWIAGTLTIDPVDPTKSNVVKITGEQKNLTINAIDNLNIEGEGKVYFENCDNFYVSAYTTTIVKSGSILSIGQNTGTFYVNGKMLVQGGAEIWGQLDNTTKGNIELYGKWNGKSELQ